MPWPSKSQFGFFRLHVEALDGARLSNMTLRKVGDHELELRAALEHNNIRRYFTARGETVTIAADRWLEKVFEHHGLGKPPTRGPDNTF